MRRRAGACGGGQLQTEPETAGACPPQEALCQPAPRPLDAERLHGGAGRRLGDLPLPAWAPSPVSPTLPKRQLLIPAAGASRQSLSFFSALLFLFCSEHTEPAGKSEQRLWGLRPAAAGPGGPGCSFHTVPSTAPADEAPVGTHPSLLPWALSSPSEARKCLSLTLLPPFSCPLGGGVALVAS